MTPATASKIPRFQKRWRWLMALVIVTPEYNHSFPGLLKHVLDSCLKEYIHKPAGIVGVSAGPFGGVRVIQDFLPVLRELGLVNIFWDVNFGNVGKVFDESGNLLDPAFIGTRRQVLERTCLDGENLAPRPGQYCPGQLDQEEKMSKQRKQNDLPEVRP